MRGLYCFMLEITDLGIGTIWTCDGLDVPGLDRYTLRISDLDM